MPDVLISALELLVGIGLLFVAPLPFVAALIFLGDEDPKMLYTWMLNSHQGFQSLQVLLMTNAGQVASHARFLNFTVLMLPYRQSVLSPQP